MENLQNTVMKNFKRFKLGNSLFKGSYPFSKENLDLLNISPEEIEKIFEREFTQQLSGFILNNHKSAIHKEKTDLGEVYHIELLVIKMNDLKTIVEACIQDINQETFDKIKAGNV